MKLRTMVELKTESYEEEQYILNRFPTAWWNSRGGNTFFYIPYTQAREVNEAVQYWNQSEK